MTGPVLIKREPDAWFSRSVFEKGRRLGGHLLTPIHFRSSHSGFLGKDAGWKPGVESHSGTFQDGVLRRWIEGEDDVGTGAIRTGPQGKETLDSED
jgi:hypothetical protein